MACAPPPEWAGAGTKKDACEICERVGVGITYHHLIPVCFALHPRGGERGGGGRRGGVDVWAIWGWMDGRNLRMQKFSRGSGIPRL